MTLDSFPVIGIALALGSALVLALGNLSQSRAVRSGGGGPSAGLRASEFRRLLTNGWWLVGALLLGASIVLQLASLAFAPLIVVQPVGVAALLFAAVFAAVGARAMPSWATIRALLVCVAGVGAFVTVAAGVSVQRTIHDEQLIAILGALAIALVAVGALLLAGRRRRLPPIAFVLLGGVMSGFVVTLGKTVILRVQTALHHATVRIDETNLLTVGCAVGILAAGALSVYLVQTAHTANRPEVVVAGLTVVDPLVAVVLAIAILREAAGAPVWAIAAFAAAGAIAILGVFLLSRASERAADAAIAAAGGRGGG